MHKRAFTLIELLVAFAVMGMLAALLLFAVGHVRDAAREIQCVNNLRQHGIAWFIYLEENNYTFPPYMYEGQMRPLPNCFGGKKGTTGLYPPASERVLNPYLEIYDETSPNIMLFYCPYDKVKRAGFPKATYFDSSGTSYLLNERIIQYKVSGVNVGRPLATIEVPHTKLCLEMCQPNMSPGHGGTGRTNFKSMVLFLDGHVEGPFGSNEIDLNGIDPDKPVLYLPEYLPEED